MPTEATSAVDPPSLAAATHWLAPLPPYPFSNLVPIIVSPGLGNRGEKLKSDIIKRYYDADCLLSVIRFICHFLYS